MDKKIIGIVGSYRKGKIIDTAVSAILKQSQLAGAETNKIYLIDEKIAFCTNCRNCTQGKNDSPRSKCVFNDMEDILGQIDDADGIVLGSPINFGNVTAVMKQFIERLLPYCYWPWGKALPGYRIKKANKKAIIITSSGCPEWLGRIIFAGALRVMSSAVKCVGAKVVQSLYFGGIWRSQDQNLSDKQIATVKKAVLKLLS